MAEGVHDQVPHRLIITLCTVGATLMQALDQTIANVALPYMQGSLSASFDEITWVLTSYITAAAIMTAPVGWMAARFGRKYLFITCLIGFTITSMMCGAAQTLDQMVVFRLLQGCFGAALVPLSQSTMLDIYSVEQRGTAMAIWGVGVMIGPILGPTFGGYLTNVQLAFRILHQPAVRHSGDAGTDLLHAARRTAFRHAVRLGRLHRAQPRYRRHPVGARPRAGSGLVQCTRNPDRGGARRAGIYLFVVHMLTARRPFIPPALFKDRNFSAGVAMMFAAGTILVSSSSLMAPWLQNLANYPVDTAGLIMAPRGIGTMAAMLLAGRVAARTDARYLMGFGIICMVWSIWEMTTWTPDINEWRLIITICIQGFGLGFLFIPLQMVAFATLPVSLRTDGASLFSLARNIGAAIGVSVTSAELARNTQALHAEIGAHVNPFNRALQDGGAAHRYLNPATHHGAAMLDHIINQQAQIIAYVDDYKMMIFTTLPALLLLFLMRRPRQASIPTESHAAMD